jgi:hypothetical protein
VEGDLVTNTSGGMLVSRWGAQSGEIKPLPRGNHCHGEVFDFSRSMPLSKNGHCHGRHLLIGNLTLGIGIDQPVDFIGAEFVALTLFDDQFNGAEFQFRSKRSSGAKGIWEHLIDGFDSRYSLEQHAWERRCS